MINKRILSGRYVVGPGKWFESKMLIRWSLLTGQNLPGFESRSTSLKYTETTSYYAICRPMRVTAYGVDLRNGYHRMQ